MPINVINLMRNRSDIYYQSLNLTIIKGVFGCILQNNFSFFRNKIWIKNLFDVLSYKIHFQKQKRIPKTYNLKLENVLYNPKQHRVFATLTQ